MLSFILMTATMVAVHWFWIRPILKSRPAFAEFYAREESVFAAAREKLKGIKQKLSSVIVIAASVAVSGYDFITPIVGGVDVSSIAAQVPSWAWPIVLICITSNGGRNRWIAPCPASPEFSLRPHWRPGGVLRDRQLPKSPSRSRVSAHPMKIAS
jgi:hypothetical protein